jgi:hypothetical protein
VNLNRPRPVLTAAGISGLITSLAGVLTWLGYVGPAADLSNRAQTIGAIVVGAVAIGSHLLAALHAQGKVTPLEQPQDHDGTPLKRADQLVPAAPTGDSILVEPVETETPPQPETPA